VIRVQTVLKELALRLARTIERDSKTLVDDVCHYHLGAPKVKEEDMAPAFSGCCSDEVRGTPRN
jgi:hypothetical protein